MKYWHTTQWQPDATTGVSFGWVQQHLGAQFRHEVVFQQPVTQLTAEERGVLFYRWACHVLTDRMPESALQESFECLRNAFEWSQINSAAPQGVLPKPSIPARHGSRRRRPDFYAEE
jgi:hypothetical protein